MPLKTKQLLTRSDFDEAVVRLRINVSEIAKETGIPRAYLSEFRNDDRKLRPEHQAKLRDFFEERGIEFEDEACRDPERNGEDAERDSVPHPALRREVVQRCSLPIAEGLSRAVVVRALNAMEISDARLLELMRMPIEREDVLFGEGDYTDETRDAMREAYTIMAGCYLLLRILRGVGGIASDDQRIQGAPRTIGRAIFDHFRESIEEAGLIPKHGKQKEADPSTNSAKASDQPAVEEDEVEE